MNIFDRWLEYLAGQRHNQREHELRLRELDNQEIQESKVCQSCEALKMEIARLHDQNNKLVDSIIEKSHPEAIQQAPIEIGPKKGAKIPWNVRRQMLENEDRAQAKILAERKRQEANESVESLERELELGEANGN